MKNKLTRRNFLRSTTVAGFASCGLLFGGQMKALANMGNLLEEDEIIDPTKLNYCGYVCPPDCKFKKASVENDTTLLREAYNIWDLKKRYNIDFNPETVYCFGCKTSTEPVGDYLTSCTVRICSKEKEYDSCIQCNELANCDKALWKKFPKFHEQVIEMQTKYKEQKG
jgi:Protein of unknown function (DUF3795)